MALNEALFQLNGGFGYVLKPSCLIKDNSFNPLALNHPNKEKVLRLSVQVISGQQLPKPPASVLGDRGEIIDPFVEVEILGVVSDSSKKVTSVIDDNGFNPIWNETFEFILYYPELAFVRFTVWDSDPIGRDFIGQRTIALKAIGPGYRHIRLTDQDFATIFVKVSKQYISVEAHKATKVSRVASKVQRKSSFLGFGDRKKSFNDSIKSDSSESSSVKRLVICNPSVITQNPTTREKSHDQDIKGSLYKKGIARPLNDVTETTNFLTKHQLDSPQRFRKLSSTCREKSSSFSKSFGCCSVSRRKKKEQKMTLIANSGAKLKPKRFSSYFSKFLGKKRSNRRYTDFSNEAIVEDIEKTPRKSPKKNKNKSCSSPYQPTIVLAKKNSFTDLLPHVDPVEDENSHKNKRIFSETLSSVDTSTPVKSKTQRVEDDHRKKLVKDLNKAFSLLQPKVTSQPSKSSNQIDQVVSEDLTSIKPAEIYSKLLATNQNTNMSTYIPKATKTDFNEKIHALSKKSRNKPRRTKSLTENFTSSQYLSKSSKHNVSMSTFKSNSSPKSMRGDLHFRFNTNIHHSVTDGQTIQINHKKEPLPSECKKSFSIPCNQTNKQPQRLKCTSLLDLTSKQYDNEEKTTVSKRIGYTCASPTKKRRQTNCTTSNDSTGSSSDLAKKIIELTSAPSESIFCPPKQTTNFRSRRPRSMVAPPIESEYVMLNPLPRMEPRETRQTNHRHSMHPKRLSLRNDPDWDQGSNLLDSQSKSLCSVKPHQICRLKDESTNYSQQNNANVYLSPGDRYRAEAVEVLSKLRRSLQDVNEESTNGNSFRQTSYNPINLQSMRSKSVEALTARSFREHSATNTEKIHHPCRSRTRARHIAKKYNMFSSNENILSTSDKPSYQRQVDDDMQGNGDYVYLSRRPPSCPNSQDRLRWSNASYPNRQPTKSSNVDSMYTDLSNCSNDGRFIVTSRSSDYYHLNLIVSNARSNPDGAEHRAPQTNQTLNNKRSSQNWMSSEPKIYYAIDV